MILLDAVMNTNDFIYGLTLLRAVCGGHTRFSFLPAVRHMHSRSIIERDFSGWLSEGMWWRGDALLIQIEAVAWLQNGE